MKTIVWDLDDVFNDLMHSWLSLAWRAEHPESKICFDELTSNPPLRELNITRDEYLDSLDRFRLSSAGENLRPNPLLCEWFEQHGHAFHHHILTARPVNCVASGAAWVLGHFGRWIHHFHFVPSSRPGDTILTSGASKAEVLQRLGSVDFFVDDSVENVREASELGICAYLFPQPWNHSPFPVDAILNDLSHFAEHSALSPVSVAGFCADNSHF